MKIYALTPIVSISLLIVTISAHDIISNNNNNNSSKFLRSLYHDDDNTKTSSYSKATIIANVNTNAANASANSNAESLVVTNSNIENRNKPCETINENNINKDVSVLSPAAMMSVPTFFSAPVLAECQINTFINPLNITSSLSSSTTISSFLWIAYVGDSLFRSPFLLLSSLLSGYKINSVDDESYLLGQRFKKKHDISTDGGTWSASETNKLHLDHVICCSHPNMTYTDIINFVGNHSVDVSNFCSVGIKTIDYDDDTITYISKLIGNHGTCFSWHWAPTISMAKSAIDGVFIDGYIHHPHAVFINSGIIMIILLFSLSIYIYNNNYY